MRGSRPPGSRTLSCKRAGESRGGLGWASLQVGRREGKRKERPREFLVRDLDLSQGGKEGRKEGRKAPREFLVRDLNLSQPVRRCARNLQSRRCVRNHQPIGR